MLADDIKIYSEFDTNTAVLYISVILNRVHTRPALLASRLASMHV